MFEWCEQVQVGVITRICEKFCAPTENVSASSVLRSHIFKNSNNKVSNCACMLTALPDRTPLVDIISDPFFISPLSTSVLLIDENTCLTEIGNIHSYTLTLTIKEGQYTVMYWGCRYCILCTPTNFRLEIFKLLLFFFILYSQ